jgi:hypothetical protein
MGCFRIRAEILPNPDSFLIPITFQVCIGITEVGCRFLMRNSVAEKKYPAAEFATPTEKEALHPILVAARLLRQLRGVHCRPVSPTWISSQAPESSMSENYWGKDAIELHYSDCEHTIFIPRGHTADHPALLRTQS